MSYDRPTHSYVECCARVPLFERTMVETLNDGSRVRVCRPGTGCWLDPWPALYDDWQAFA